MWSYLKSHLNFYRIHVLLFILIPLLASIIFWASNGKFKIDFIDSVFVCVSAATGTGLTTTDLSSLTAWQQAIIVILELFGNQVFVSWVVVYLRRQYFLAQLEYIVAAELERNPIHRGVPFRRATPISPPTISGTLFHRRHHKEAHLEYLPSRTLRAQTKPIVRQNSNMIRPDMVRRVDIAPHLVDPSGRSETRDGGHAIGPQSPSTVEAGHLLRVSSRRTFTSVRRSPSPQPDQAGYFGGFPGPQDLLGRAVHYLFPRVHRTVQRRMTMPRTETLVPSTISHPQGPAKPVPYISFSAVVSKNSAFKNLTDKHIEELGGIEYRALSALLWIVPLYYFGILAISFVVVAPYMTLPRWKSILLPPEQHRKINAIWFSAFQVIGAWANTGMSLVDQNMVPFRTAYPMIAVLVVCVLAGNTAYPIFIRFLVWVLGKAFPEDCRTKEALHFLLDHPRRCFISMFPSNQTWLLFGIQLIIYVIAWMFDLILNIGNPAIAMISVGVRVINAVLQAAAVRSAGFQSVPVASFVPAVQLLYVILMYIAIYPIAISVRSTNVYEEKSLGIYGQEDQSDEDDGNDPRNRAAESRVAIWGRYLYRHIRRQLSFDMWWLALTLFLLCVIERSPLMNTQNSAWFTMFALIFELVSAYGTVGLSLGVPYANYSFSGALHTLSKLIMCAVMIRGRHRGLPVALDRAVMLPHEFRRPSDSEAPLESDGSRDEVQAQGIRMEDIQETKERQSSKAL